MSIENPTTINGKDPNTLELVIRWNQITGEISVTGPIGNTVVAFGMMEAAKDSIIKFLEKMKSSGGVVGATSLPVNLRM